MLRRLQSHDFDVTVVPTKSSLEFVGSATWEALSGKSISTDVFENVYDVPHVKLGQEADLIVVAPATANLIAKLAHGLADDLLTNTVLMATCPILIVPAMHTEMWANEATQANVATLRSRGIRVLNPDSGRLTGPDSGPGRLPDPASLEIASLVASDGFDPELDLTGKRVLVTGGGTLEAIDPVRYVGNRSSGKQAWAIATAAAVYGADVTVIAANVDLPPPVGANVIGVRSADDMAKAIEEQLDQTDILVMAAAVADFRPADPTATKIKKTSSDFVPEPIELERTVDILAMVGERPRSKRPLLVGFAAETVDDDDQLITYASEKLLNKGADLLVANRVGADLTFGADTNSVWILDASGVIAREELTSKAGVANALLKVL